MLLADDALCLAIPEQPRALVGRFVAMKLWPERAGWFRWDAVRAPLQRAAQDGERVPDGGCDADAL